ncbi:MAG: hypothetical protein EYC62_00260 [Alphaproteobacteria bacterium]|nr:MAG: hypothetical protein EYC62_00260 [Alphaproteobacteria bacterium]
MAGKNKSEPKTVRVNVGEITTAMLAKLRRRRDVKESTLYPPERAFVMTPATLKTLKSHPNFRHVFAKCRAAKAR